MGATDEVNFESDEVAGSRPSESDRSQLFLSDLLELLNERMSLTGIN